MKKVELLSPVGNMETLYFAIHNGCDAVYFAGKKFGARKFANNFSEEEIVDAIKYCHLYGVKAYITVNTLMFDNELEEIKFEDLPEDWVCPLCGVGKDMFEKVEE